MPSLSKIRLSGSVKDGNSDYIEEIVTAENDNLSVWKVVVETHRSVKAGERLGTDQRVFESSDKVDVGIYNAFD